MCDWLCELYQRRCPFESKEPCKETSSEVTCSTASTFRNVWILAALSSAALSLYWNWLLNFILNHSSYNSTTVNSALGCRPASPKERVASSANSFLGLGTISWNLQLQCSSSSNPSSSWSWERMKSYKTFRESALLNLRSILLPLGALKTIWLTKALSTFASGSAGNLS